MDVDDCGAAGVKKGAVRLDMVSGVAEAFHGYTSCVMLPSVLAWNEGVNDEQQAMVSETLGDQVPASQVIGELISRLRDVGVKQDQFQEAAASMHDRWIPSNPRRSRTPHRSSKF